MVAGRSESEDSTPLDELGLEAIVNDPLAPYCGCEPTTDP